jgi:cell division protein FtsI/penicillin-binding protein 2
VVVADPNTGRVLTMVNQKLGLQAGFTPCSTIKLVTSLAALNEHVVERDTVIHLEPLHQLQPHHGDRAFQQSTTSPRWVPVWDSSASRVTRKCSV